MLWVTRGSCGPSCSRYIATATATATESTFLRLVHSAFVVLHDQLWRKHFDELLL